MAQMFPGNDLIRWSTLEFSGGAAELFSLFQDEPHAFLLESSLEHPSRGRYSLIGFDPWETFAGSGPNALQDLRRRAAPFLQQVRSSGLTDFRLSPFPAGLMGYLSYDWGLGLEGIQPKKKSGVAVPDVFFGFYDGTITLDHLTGRVHVTAGGWPEKKASLREKRAKERIETIVRRLNRYRPPVRSSRLPVKSHASSLSLTSNFSRKDYLKAVREALGYISRGDIYQVNLSQRFCLDAPNGRIDPLQLYRTLRELSPSCFSGYFDAGDFQIISSSPERFLRLRGDLVETRPMKGTRPRGVNPQDDAKKRNDLRQSRKDRAELLMITDLERNDLGKVCAYGSVQVREMRRLEEYRTVFQATSTVEGRLSKGKDCFDLLQAAFPGGSITGCPKIRAMEIIEELEPSARGIYTGSMGYINLFGGMDFNVLIRTLMVRGKKIYFHAGGGIVADSEPAQEYQETLVKARAMQEAVRIVLSQRKHR